MHYFSLYRNIRRCDEFCCSSAHICMMRVQCKRSRLSSVCLTRLQKRCTHTHQVVLGFGHVGVVRAEPTLVDLQRSAVIILHLLVLALILTQQRQVIQLLGHVRMILPQHLTHTGINKQCLITFCCSVKARQEETSE